MRSVADALRHELRDSVRELSPEERIRHAYALGEAGLATFMEAKGLSRAEAMRRLEIAKQRGRRHSASLRSLFE